MSLVDYYLALGAVLGTGIAVGIWLLDRSARALDRKHAKPPAE
jgi:hypothetical protein